RELSQASTISRVLARPLARGHTTTELVTLVVESRLDLTELQVTPYARTFASGEAVVAFMEASAFGTFLPAPDVRAALVAAFDVERMIRGWTVSFVATR